jgi:hypothetical protein
MFPISGVLLGEHAIRKETKPGNLAELLALRVVDFLE